MTNETAYQGAQDAGSNGGDYNQVAFVIQQLVSRLATATLVQVQAVSNTPGQVTAVGRVDVLPMVNQINGYGDATPHGVLHNLPYFRFAGGNNAILLDPQVGDLGIVIFCDHDISSVKATGKQANPGSRRRFDMADGIFIGLCIGPTPERYIAFTDSGINIVVKAGETVAITGNITATGGITAGQGTGDSVTLQGHTHPDPQGGNTGIPNAGT